MNLSEHNEHTITGTFQGSGRGFGFFRPEGASGREEDLFVPPRQTGGAWDGDRVEALPGPDDPKRPGSPTVRIVTILERHNRAVTGVIRRSDHQTWLQPDNDRLPGPIKVTGGRAKGGERCAVTVTGYGSPTTPPTGTVERTFGPAADRASAVAAILYREGIEGRFPDPVLSEAKAAPQSVPPQALKGRLDLRDKTIITIDGASSKDLDDAVSLEKEGDNWALGVHIADVSHYVTPGSALDGEAFARGTSVYFADRVIPMLPVELSNGICSLNQGVDRLTLSCIMTMDSTGAVLDHKLCPSVIRSTERMTYEDCNALLAGEDPALAARYVHILPMLRDMAALAAALEKRRRARGGLDLESQESYILCNEAGEPVDVIPRSPGVSEGLIESFMLAANETVAKHLFDLKFPAVYRVHEKPSADKGETLKAMLSPLGLTLPQMDNFALQKVLKAVEGRPEAPAVNMMVLRSLMKARYATEDLGHFGLAAPHYCHFTSPIRRYPDLMVHRCLHALWEGAGEKGLSTACQRAALQSSQREVAAQTAERDIEKLYFAQFMAGHLGESFPAAVSGVTRFGLFASLPSGVEGLIPVETLPQDDYVYDETRLTLTGERTGTVYTFGMPLTVVCVAADPASGRVDLRLPGREEAPAPERHEDRPLPKVRRKKTAPSGRGRRDRPAMHVPKRGKGRRR